MLDPCNTADRRKVVVDLNCRSHDGPNLWITDAAVLPTSAAVNPVLTIAALAWKPAAAIAFELEHGGKTTQRPCRNLDLIEGCQGNPADALGRSSRKAGMAKELPSPSSVVPCKAGWNCPS